MFFKLTPVVKILLLLNFVVYVCVCGNLLFSNINIAGLSFELWSIKVFALQPLHPLLYAPGVEGSFAPWQLITYQFMHGSFSHIFFNMFGLWMFSSELEELWGSAKFLVYYLLSGIGAGILNMLISEFTNSSAPMVGASGALYGIFIGFALLNPDRRIMMFPLFIPIRARWFAIGIMSLELIRGVFFSSDGVAHFAHLGGALTGILLIKLGEKTPLFRWTRSLLRFGLPSNESFYDTNRRKSFNYSTKYNNEYNNEYRINYNNYTNSQSYTSSEQTSKPTSNRIYNVNGQIINQDTLDIILDKISKNGYASLNDQEKYILTEISKQI